MIECSFSSYSDADSFPQESVFIRCEWKVQRYFSFSKDLTWETTWGHQEALSLPKLLSSVLASSQGKLSPRAGENKTEQPLQTEASSSAAAMKNGWSFLMAKVFGLTVIGPDWSWQVCLTRKGEELSYLILRWERMLHRQKQHISHQQEQKRVLAILLIQCLYFKKR